MSLADDYLKADSTFQTARATNQSDHRCYDFRPATFDARVRPFSVLRALPSLIVIGAVVALFWTVLT